MDGHSDTEAILAASNELTSNEFRVDFSGLSALQQVERLSELLKQLPETETLLRVKLLARLTAAQLPLDPKEADRTLKELHLLAHAADNETARAYALVASNVCDLSAVNPKQRVADTKNALDICIRTRERQLIPMAFFLRIDALLQTADLEGIDKELSAKTSSLQDFHHLLEGRHATWARCMRATIDGRLKEAVELVELGFVRGEQEGDPDSHIVRVGQIAVIRWLQGQVDEVEPYLLQARQAFPEEIIWAAGVAWIWNHQGRSTAAKGMLETIGSVKNIPEDRHWLAGLAILAEVAAKLGDPDLVSEIYGELLPHENELAPIGLGVTSWGPVARSLALLAHSRGDISAAEAHFRRAIDLCSRLGAQVWLAQSQIGLAELLFERGINFKQARDLAEQAVKAAEHLGLGTIEFQARALLERLDGSPTTTQARIALESRSAKRPRIEVLNRFQVYDTQGHEVVWRSHKAAQLLKILVARRGVPIPREQLLEHLWPDDDQKQLNNRFAVAISTIRTALDPGKQHPRGEFVRLAPHSVSLNLTFLDVDCEEFLEKAQRVEPDAPIEFLTRIIDSYKNGFLADEPYAAWAETLRREVDVVFGRTAHLLARKFEEQSQFSQAANLYRRLIAVDEFDQTAHEGLIRTLQALGAHGQARDAHEAACTTFAELGIDFPRL